jgi:hypothetical protein
MSTLGNLILMALLCVAVFIVFMAIRPSPAPAWTFYAASCSSGGTQPTRRWWSAHRSGGFDVE